MGPLAFDLNRTTDYQPAPRDSASRDLRCPPSASLISRRLTGPRSAMKRLIWSLVGLREHAFEPDVSPELVCCNRSPAQHCRGLPIERVQTVGQRIHRIKKRHAGVLGAPARHERLLGFRPSDPNRTGNRYVRSVSEPSVATAVSRPTSRRLGNAACRKFSLTETHACWRIDALAPGVRRLVHRPARYPLQVGPQIVQVGPRKCRSAPFSCRSVPVSRDPNLRLWRPLNHPLVSRKSLHTGDIAAT